MLLTHCRIHYTTNSQEIYKKKEYKNVSIYHTKLFSINCIQVYVRMYRILFCYYIIHYCKQ